MQHYLPRLGAIVPVLGIQFLARFQLLHRLAQPLFLRIVVSALDELYHPVSDEFAVVADVVEDRMAQVLEVDSDLMRPAGDWVALKQRTVGFRVVP